MWIGTVWGVLYLLLVSIPIVFGSTYNFNLGEIGLVYSSQVVASFLGMAFSVYTNKLYFRHVERKGPEARLWAGMFGALQFGIGCWWFV